MPIPTDTLYNIKRLNVIFALCAVLLLAAMSWMLWHDYDRPWRDTQTDYFNLRSAMAHFEVLAYESPEALRELDRLQAAVAEAEARLATPTMLKESERLSARERDISGELQSASLAFGNQNAELQVLAFEYEESKTLAGEDDPATVAMRAEHDEQSESLAVLKQREDRLQDELREVQAGIKSMYLGRELARKELSAYEKGRSDAETRFRMFGPGFSRLAFNLPGLDFAAPKGVAGRQEVRQVFMPSIRFDYNFVDSYVTDRCITCHVGIDDPELTIENFVAKAQAAMTAEQVSSVLREENVRLQERLLGRLQRSGDDQLLQPGGKSTADAIADRGKFVDSLVHAANTFLERNDRPLIDQAGIVAEFATGEAVTRDAVMEAVSTAARAILTAARPFAADGKTQLPLADMTDRQRDDYSARVLAAINAYFRREGLPPITFDKVLRAHPDLNLYISVDSPHPMAKMGCTVCHEGSGQETDFVLAAHTPKSPAEKEAWEEYYVKKELGIPLATFHLVEEYWERPMLLPDYTAASCRKCHDQTYDLQRYQGRPLESAERVVQGRDLFTSLGCIDCHNVEGLSEYRRVGTDLTHVADKLSAGFMERWIEYPNNFRPSTRMPHFFHQENNQPTDALPTVVNEFDPDPILRTETEIQAITYFLRTFSTSYEPAPLPEGLAGDAARGADLFVSTGCLACHANLDAVDRLDEDGRSFGEVWITADLRDAAKRGGAELSAEDAGRQVAAMSKNERVRYAMRNLTPDRRAKALAARDAAILHAAERGEDPEEELYVPPAFTRYAPELSGIGSKLVKDAGEIDQVVQGTTWLYNWLAEPRHYHALTKMPVIFRENQYWQLPEAERKQHKDQDILDVAAYLLTLRHDDFDQTPIPDDQLHAEKRSELILALLSGQNTQSVSGKILNDEKFDESAPYGEMTRAIVAQTYNSLGGGPRGRARAQAIIEAKSASLPDRRKLFLGMKMIGHYGCFACHDIPGFEDTARPGTDMSLWAEKFMSQLDFGFYAPLFEEELEHQPEVFANLYLETAAGDHDHLIRDATGNSPHTILHNHGAFAYHKMRNPRIWDRGKIKKPYEKLKMPNYFLTDEEAKSVVTFLLSRRGANVREDVRIAYGSSPLGKIAAGRALAAELNCVGCHVIEDTAPLLHQYYTDNPDVGDEFPFGARFKPPLLWGEGAKVQYDWLFKFLNNVEMLRPWLNVRMPSFDLTTEDTTRLVEYFAGLSQYDSGMLQGQLAPVVKYLQRVHSIGGAPAGEEDAPMPDWFLEDRFAGQAEFLKQYALMHEQVRPYDFDVSYAQTRAEKIETLGPTYDKITQRFEFLSGLFDVEYPFTNATAHGLDDAGFKLGEDLFYNQRCLACHVAGDPSVKGTTTNITAPNFALTGERLRYDWVIKWLQDPQAIQPGANMPQIFQGGGSAFASLPPEARDELEAKFGKTPEEQVALLVDFLFELGARRYTAVQPGGLGEEEGEQEGDLDPDEFDDEFGDDGDPMAEDEFEDEFEDDSGGGSS